MTTIIPSKIFNIYVNDMLKIQIAKPDPIDMDAFLHRLWDAASFDSYILGQNPIPLLDEQGNPREEASAYVVLLIDAAKLEYIKGRG